MNASDRIVVLNIITGLYTGGAEMMLYKLLSKMNRDRFSPVVISLMDRGTLGDRIAALDIPVHTIGIEPGNPQAKPVWQFIRQVRQIQPNLVQGWMYHGNLAAQLYAASTLRSVPILWNVRQSLYSLKHEKLGTAAVIKLLAQLSWLPKKILYNTKTGAIQHEKIGYQKAKTLVIPNGFDPEIFVPSVEARISVREELQVGSDALLIGIVGRYHPMKDHANFVQAAASLSKKYPHIQFVMSGREIDERNQTLCKQIHDLKLANRVHLLGERRDISRLTAALDIATSASAHGEGFANVVGEAMSCGVSCAVTDVGDSAWIVGDTGRIVPPQNAQALARAWEELIEIGAEARQTLGTAARTRIVENFSLNSVVVQYETLYESLLTKKLQSEVST
ncbi:MAG: putative glycosyltransferase EpsF [Chroococcidiopsis sp. SAG 2025]|uniref:glycosyltransferase family 4 protein n=1 Tax=Chroococcidiopsis sp. SAG 2025 TaxID=171389 RepID=UPI002936D5E0|nr:glycosyltransferase [Chroococcidiopsis sp. SAG 2025]MDV2991081.1 putative glycosyltransferase EpsF [Chroococcidiopsis sp. SAG 2025]